MKVKNVFGFSMLGYSFSKIENEIADLSKQLEIESETIGKITPLAIDKLRNIGNRIDSKIIDPCLKYGWTDSTPYKMGRGAYGLEQTTIGNLKDYLFMKYNIMIQFAEGYGVNLLNNQLHFIDQDYIESR